MLDVYCYYDNYKTILEEIKKEGYYCLKMKYITDVIFQVWLWQDYEVAMYFVPYIDYVIARDHLYTTR